MEASSIKVTVFCAAYNHESYIRDALNGFVMQETDFPFEVIVHDDASTDSTAEIIREYENKYPDIIKPIYQPENIYSKNINRTYEYMLPRTHGKYIAVCEGDDYWTDPKKLQKQFDYMESHPECSLVAHLALTHHINGDYFCKYTNRDFSTPEKCEISADEIIMKHTVFPTASMFYRKEYYCNNKDFLVNIKSFDYVSKTLLATEGTVYVIPEIMSVYRQGSSGSWTERISYNPDKLEVHLNQSIETMRKIDEYRQYKYHNVIQKNILSRQFDAQKKLLNLKTLKNEPYKELYGQLSLKEKLLLHTEKYAPALYVLYRKATAAVKKYINRKIKV